MDNRITNHDVLGGLLLLCRTVTFGFGLFILASVLTEHARPFWLFIAVALLATAWRKPTSGGARG